MSYTILTCEQRSDEWFKARAGRLTASVAGDMLATIKTGEAAARRNLRLRLVLERLTGKPQESGYVSAAMLQGIEREAEARAFYEALTGNAVENTGFVQHKDHMAGASLDGCVFGQFGGIWKILELKSPEPSAHLAVIRTGNIGAAYQAQVMHSLWITGAESCDWMSYNPDFPEKLRAKLITIQRDDAAIAEYERKALEFLAEVDRELAEVANLEVAV